MTYVIFDLEWVATFLKGQLPEIIAIGAVKVQEQNGSLQETGRFEAFVRPHKARLNKRTIKMTGIRHQDIQASEEFPQVWKRFLDWIGEDDYALLTWGSEDVRTLLKNARLHRMSLEWLRNYNDLQGLFGKLYGLPNQAGLMLALEMLQKEPVGRHHSAMDDARNTAEIFRACYGQLVIEQNRHREIKQRYAPNLTKKPNNRARNRAPQSTKADSFRPRKRHRAG